MYSHWALSFRYALSWASQIVPFASWESLLNFHEGYCVLLPHFYLLVSVVLRKHVAVRRTCRGGSLKTFDREISQQVSQLFLFVSASFSVLPDRQTEKDMWEHSMNKYQKEGKLFLLTARLILDDPIHSQGIQQVPCSSQLTTTGLSEKWSFQRRKPPFNWKLDTSVILAFSQCPGCFWRSIVVRLPRINVAVQPSQAWKIFFHVPDYLEKEGSLLQAQWKINVSTPVFTEGRIWQPLISFDSIADWGPNWHQLELFSVACLSHAQPGNLPLCEHCQHEALEGLMKTIYGIHFQGGTTTGFVVCCLHGLYTCNDF